MYCPTCGVAVNSGSTYCNYCGEHLGVPKTETIAKSPEVRPGNLIGAMVFTFVFGLGAIAILLGMMKAVLRLEPGQILAFAFLSFLIMISLEGVFTLLLFRRRHSLTQPPASLPAKGPVTSELNAAPAHALAAPLSSVTEHTTRAFEPIYRERNDS
jgi:hypothetical protein